MSSELDVDPKPASAIAPPDKKPETLLSDVFEAVEEFLQETSGIDANTRSFFIRGLSKNIDTDFNMVELLKDQSRIIYDYIKISNKKLPLKDNAVLKSFFDGLLLQYELLNSLDIEVARNELFAYIIGYNLRIIKNNYDRTTRKEV